MGRVLLVNALVGSLFVYKLTVLPFLKTEQIAKFYQIIRKFVWNYKKPKIALDILQVDKSVGGLRLVDLRKKDLSLKLVWVKELQQEDSFFASVFYQQLKAPIKNKIWKCQLSSTDAKAICASEFWGNVLVAWNIFSSKSVITVKDISEQIIWGNSTIKINNDLVFNQNAWEAGLVTIADLIEDKKLMTFDMVCAKYGQVLNWYEHAQIIDAIPSVWKNVLMESGPVWSFKGRNVNIIPGLTANFTYTQMIQINDPLRKKREKWEKVLHCSVEEEDFEKKFKAIYVVTIETKLRNFQYRLLTHAIVTNRQLKLWKVKDSELCSFCGRVPETYTHLFFDCKIVRNLWMDVFTFLERWHINELQFNAFTIIFNEVHRLQGHIANFIVLLVKQIIYRARCFKSKISIEHVLKELQHVYSIEEYLANKNDRWNQHVKKWKPIKPSLQYKNSSNLFQMYVDNL